MEKTIDYLKAVEARTGTTTNRDTAVALGVTEMSVWRYRSGAKTFSDDVAVRVAEVLGIEPALVILDIHTEQARSGPARDAWSQIATAFRTTRKKARGAAGTLLTFEGGAVAAGVVLGEAMRDYVYPDRRSGDRRTAH